MTHVGEIVQRLYLKMVREKMTPEQKESLFGKLHQEAWEMDCKWALEHGLRKFQPRSDG
jgi:hypothetical protein